jgi:glutathione S-transferase
MSNTTYTLYYWPSIPGRGEYVRMLFEAAHAPYTDNTDVGALQARVMATDTVGHPPHFAPPILGVTPAGGPEWFLSQTPAILAFLGPRLGLVGDVDGEPEASREQRRAHVQQLTLTALDLMLEAHDTHHPIANGLYCEHPSGRTVIRLSPSAHR